MWTKCGNQQVTKETRMAFWREVEEAIDDYTPQNDDVAIDELLGRGLVLDSLAMWFEGYFGINLVDLDYEDWETVGRWVHEIAKLREGN